MHLLSTAVIKVLNLQLRTSRSKCVGRYAALCCTCPPSKVPVHVAYLELDVTSVTASSGSIIRCYSVPRIAKHACRAPIAGYAPAVPGIAYHARRSVLDIA
eukprot:2393398-Rhodomonas_salina.5